MSLMSQAKCGCCGKRMDGRVNAGTLIICDYCRNVAIRYLVSHDLADGNPFAVMLAYVPGSERREARDFPITLIWNWQESETHYIKFPLTGCYSYASLTGR